MSNGSDVSSVYAASGSPPGSRESIVKVEDWLGDQAQVDREDQTQADGEDQAQADGEDQAQADGEDLKNLSSDLVSHNQTNPRHQDTIEVVAPRWCYSCQTTMAPLWRKDDNGRTFCNAYAPLCSFPFVDWVM